MGRCGARDLAQKGKLNDCTFLLQCLFAPRVYQGAEGGKHPCLYVPKSNVLFCNYWFQFRSVGNQRYINIFIVKIKMTKLGIRGCAFSKLKLTIFPVSSTGSVLGVLSLHCSAICRQSPARRNICQQELYVLLTFLQTGYRILVLHAM